MPAGTGTGKKIFGINAKRIGRILTGSFILIAVIHIVVFTAIGLFTPAGWRLLWIFLFGLAVMLLVVLPLKRLRRKKAVKDCHSEPSLSECEESTAEKESKRKNI